jgi:hypothetical protein
MENTFENFELNEEGKPYNIRHRCFFFSKEAILFVKESKYDKIYSSLFDQLIRSATSIELMLWKGELEVQRKTGETFM